MTPQKKTRPPRPLLDRFLGGPPEDLDGYIAVILRDLEALLNTRSDRPPEGGDPATVLDYGLGDLSVAGRSESDLLRLALAVKKRVEVFEPRLCRVQVEPLPELPPEPDRVRLRLTAALAGFETQPRLDLELPLELKPAPGLG